MRNNSGYCCRFAVSVLLTTIGASGCDGKNGSPTDPGDQVDMSAQIVTNPTDPTFGTFTTRDDTVITIVGDKTLQGHANRVRMIAANRVGEAPEKAVIVRYDEAGRMIEVSHPTDGRLKINYYNTGAARFTWSAAGSAEEYQATLPSIVPANAGMFANLALGNSMQHASPGSALSGVVPLTGRIRVVCGEGASMQKVSGADVRVWRIRPAPGPGLPESSQEIPTSEVEPGLHQYVIPDLQYVGPPLSELTEEIRSAIDVACSGLQIVAGREAAIASVVSKNPSVIARIVVLLKTGRFACDASVILSAVAKLHEASAPSGPVSVLATRPPHGSGFDRFTPTESDLVGRVLRIDGPCPQVQLSGTWSGSEFQPDAEFTDFDVVIRFTQSGNVISGTLKETIKGQPYYVEASFTGVIDGTLVTWQGERIISQIPPPGSYFCLVNYAATLRTINGASSLTGTFRGGGCSPGTIELTRTSD